MGKKGTFFITIGLLLLAAALLLTVYNVWDSHRAGVAAQEAVQSLKTMLPSPGETASEPTEETSAQKTTAPTEEAAPPEQTQPPAPLPEGEMPTVELNGYDYIGVLEVASLELSLPVMDQWDYERLKISPCRFAGNVYEDNLVICGHNYSQHFQPLKYVPVGTQVQFTDAVGNVFRYAVSSFDTVGPNDVERMISGDWDLTLFTCNVSGQTRCAIRCDRIE